MKALCWNGVNQLSTERVPDPEIVNPRDAIIRVRLSSVCGSDLHLLDGYVPTMKEGDIIGHEFLGEVVETGPGITGLQAGERVVVPSIVACGNCYFCRHDQYSLCDNSNPQPDYLDQAHGHASCGIYGYSHAFGGYAGSHAEYIRVPFADVGAFRVPEEVTDEQALFTSDAVPTGYMAAEMCSITPGDVVAVWGAGGVGLMAIHSAWLLGAGRVISIDRLPERLALARTQAGAETIDYEESDVHEELLELTAGRGPDACIDAVGMEAHGTGLDYAYDRAKQAVGLHTGRPQVLREAIRACRKGGTISIVGVYDGIIDKFPLGAAFNKALTLRMGQMHGQKYVPRLLHHVLKGDLDPSYLLTHRLGLDDGPVGYDLFKHRKDGCIRAVFDPAMAH